MELQIALWISFAGFVIGLLFKARYLPFVALIIFGLGWAGLLRSGSSHNEAMTWAFGVALMASPIIGMVAIPGLLLGQILRLIMRWIFRERGPTSSRRWSD